ncbi:orf155 [Lactobacillus phage LP65]|uniref:Orf155 n=1 Tax=Lactobacillus phage LP65 TaxID=2892344 RepID=Q5ULF9_9CAUD|nr:hypothetical protein LP65_gp155 [Lactobacillus phage LP65]AAV35975.1 orf155 [Lactobacillus phage LP65]
MRTKEFITRMSKLGYKALPFSGVTEVIFNRDGYTGFGLVATISEKNCNSVKSSFTDGNANADEAFDLIVSYAKTPISERKPAKKYFIHVFRSQQDGYLTLVNDKAEFGSRLEATSFSIKTRFTKKEIRQLKKREDIPLDWDKVTLAEA